MVAAIAFESVVKLLAFLTVGAFVVWGPVRRAGRHCSRNCPRCQPTLLAALTASQGKAFAYGNGSLTLLAG